MRRNTRKSGAKAALAHEAAGIDVLAELAALKAMTVPELQGKWRGMFAQTPATAQMRPAPARGEALTPTECCTLWRQVPPTFFPQPAAST